MNLRSQLRTDKSRKSCPDIRFRQIISQRDRYTVTRWCQEFTLYSSVADGSLGSGVGAVGDFNNDGVAGLIVGAESADSGLQSNTAAYIVYGKCEIIFASGFIEKSAK